MSERSSPTGMIVTFLFSLLALTGCFIIWSITDADVFLVIAVAQTAVFLYSLGYIMGRRD